MAMAPHGHQRAVQGRKLPAEVQGGRMSQHSLGKKAILQPPFGLVRFYQSSSSREAMSQPTQRSLKTLPQGGPLRSQNPPVSVATGTYISAGVQETKAFQSNMHVSHPGNWLNYEF